MGGPKFAIWINTNHTVNDSMQTIHRCFNPEASSIYRYPFMYSLPEDRELNGYALWLSSKANTQNRNFAFSPMDCRQPKHSTAWWQTLYVPHTYRYATARILAAWLFTSLLQGAPPSIFSLRPNWKLCSGWCNSPVQWVSSPGGKVAGALTTHPHLALKLKE
jgi:hypothetical protein